MSELSQANKGISGYTLKMIAVITMLIDHTAASILERMVFQIDPNGYYTVQAGGLYSIYMVMRIIGRMAFPIYCYMIVEGLTYTRNVKKYAARLLIFAAISELPFDMALFNSFFDIGHNNVFLTLFLGLVTIAIVDYLIKNLNCNPVLNKFAQLGVVLLGMLLAELLHTDYGAAGIAAIVVIYMLRNRKMLAFGMGVVVLGIMAGTMELAALFMLIPMYFYNGTRGKQAKYFFYAFYPAHLLILAGICALLGLGI